MINKILSDNGYLEYEVYENSAQLLYIHVDESYRRQGQGRRLMDSLITTLGITQIKGLYGFVLDSNKIAQDFYKSLGFHLSQDVFGFYGLRKHICLFFKSL